jgi:hypothetical protein
VWADRDGSDGALAAHSIVDAVVVHRRRRPRENAFRYRVAYLCLGLGALEQAAGRWLRIDRPGLVSFRRADHGARDGSDLRAWLYGILAGHGLAGVCDGEPVLMTLPRLLGYVFNPVSFYWLYRADGELACMISELGNTFGERMPELLRGPDLRYAHEKKLHVSPFFGLDQHYEYAFSQPGEEVWARIHVHDNAGGTPMTAVLHGRRRELTNRSLARVLARYPLQPLQVTALIHWQALRLWLKRLPFHHKPPFVPGKGSARP